MPRRSHYEQGADQELRVARAVGGSRTYDHGGVGWDVETDFAVYESKRRARFPFWVESALLKLASARPEGKNAYLVLTYPGCRNPLVVELLSQHQADHGGKEGVR